MAMMQGELDGRIETGKATTAIAGRRFCQRVAGGWKQCSVAGERVDGISVHDAVLGAQDAVFFVGGINLVTSGAALADAQEIATDAQGRAIPFVAANHKLAGLSEAAASAADVLTLARHYPGGISRA